MLAAKLAQKLLSPKVSRGNTHRSLMNGMHPVTRGSTNRSLMNEEPPVSATINFESVPHMAEIMMAGSLIKPSTAEILRKPTTDPAYFRMG